MHPGTDRSSGLGTGTAAHSGEFWQKLDAFTQEAELRIDRPKATSHPRFPQYVYPVDYGYLDGTQGGDGEGIDVWRGTGEPHVVGVVATLDPFKRNAEIKILFGCLPEEIKSIEDFYDGQPQSALLVLRPGMPLPPGTGENGQAR
ncbi:inorganic pyrophosphatase [Streptomyces olivoreticuli]